MSTEIVIIGGILQAIGLPVLAYVARKTIDNGELLAKLVEQLRAAEAEKHDIRKLLISLDARVRRLELKNASRLQDTSKDE